MGAKKKSVNGSGMSSRDAVAENDVVEFTLLIPTIGCVEEVADLLYTCEDMPCYNNDKKSQIVLLLDRYDECLAGYIKLTELMIRRGKLKVGYILFEGCSYTAMVNRAALMVASRTFCVGDCLTVPVGKDSRKISDIISDWRLNIKGEDGKALKGGCKVGVFKESEDTELPVVTKEAVERLGYLFNPICRGRKDAEIWITTLAGKAKRLCEIDGMVGIKNTNVQIDEDPISSVTDEDVKWSTAVLSVLLDEESVFLMEASEWEETLAEEKTENGVVSS